MKRLRAWANRLTALLFVRQRERELAEEIDSHVEMHTADNIRRGMTPEAARRAAVLQLGGIEPVKERCRDQRGVPLVANLGQDFRYASRTLRRSPGVTALAVATIAIGIAGPTVMFTMAKAWIFDPLPFADAAALVDLRNLNTTTGGFGSISVADFLDWRRAVQSIDIAGYRDDQFRLTGGDRAERVRGAAVTPNFFALLGAQPSAGRLFNERDGNAGAAPVAVISDQMWRERFGSDPGILGRTMRLDDESTTIVGVLPASFQFTLVGGVRVWRPLAFTAAEASDRTRRSVIGVGRLHPGRTVEQARAELVGIAEDLSKRFPQTNATRGVRVLRLADEIRRHHDLGFLIPVLFATVGCVLLVACVNVTNVMLARASTRRQELAVRLALGASRLRIVRQWLVEHVLLFVGAGVLGAALAVYGAGLITQSIPADNRQYLRAYGVLRIGASGVVFALLAGALCGVLFGWLPAWTAMAANVNNDLREGSARGSAGRAGARLRTLLMTSQMAFALAVLVTAALLVATSRTMLRTDVGFERRGLLTFQVGLDPVRYQDAAAIRTFYARLMERLARSPGVDRAAAGSFVPFGDSRRSTELFLEGEPERPPSETPIAAYNAVTPGYAEAMGLRVRRGRMPAEGDDPSAPRVVVVNDTLAEKYFAGRDPLGRRVRLGRRSQDLWTIVGVVGDVKNNEVVDAPFPQVYVPFAQDPRLDMTVVLRSTSNPIGLAAIARESVAAIDPAEPVDGVLTMEELIRRVTAPFEITAAFVTFFGVVTLLLAAVGVYGVISYTFARRTREIGIRMALGASRFDVARLVARQIRTFLVAGMLPGLLMAWVLGHALEAMLFGVTPGDWRVYSAMTVLLATVALVAALLPARRVTAIDPVAALRHE